MLVGGVRGRGQAASSAGEQVSAGRNGHARRPHGQEVRDRERDLTERMHVCMYACMYGRNNATGTGSDDLTLPATAADDESSPGASDEAYIRSLQHLLSAIC